MITLKNLIGDQTPQQGKFAHLARKILQGAGDGGLRPEQVYDMIGNENGGKFNCYPGVPGNKCHPLAVFVALHGKLRRGGRWPYDFEGILQAMVQHVQGTCPDVTKNIVLITDSWWAPNFEKWQGNIENMKKTGIHLEIYLMSFPDVISSLRI